MNLRQKLFGPLLLIVTVPVIIVGWFAYSFISETSKTALINSVNDNVQSATPSLAQKFHTAENNLHLFASSRLIQDYIIRGEERYILLQPSLIRQFKDYQEVYPDYFSIKLIMESGEVDSLVDNRRESEMIFDVSDTTFFQVLKNNQSNDVVALIEREVKTDKNTLNLGKPITFQTQFSNQKGSLKVHKVYITLAFYLDYIEDMLAAVAPSSGGSFMIVTDQNNQVMYASADSNFDFSNKILNIDDAQTAHFKTDDNNEEYYYSSAPIGYGLYLYALVPTNTFSAAANELAIDMMLFFAATAFSIFLLSLLYIRGILLTPIYKIKNVVSDISKGNLNATLSLIDTNDELGQLSKSIVTMRNKIRQNKIDIEKLAYYDELTGLPNRLMLKTTLSATIDNTDRSSSEFALVFLDLDNFKNVNDTLGHDVGDQLLVEASERIMSCIGIQENEQVQTSPINGSKPILARLGGDEFTILFPNIKDASAVETKLSNIIESLTTPFEISNHVMTVGASIGVAIYPADGVRSSDLLKNADLAMYEAKRNGKNCYMFYKSEMNSAAYERQALESKLKSAIENDEFALHYQPRVRVNDHSSDGFEALIRWNHSELGCVSPLQFVPIAETNLLIIQIGRRVLEKACEKIKHWISFGYSDFHLSINVSPIQLQRDNFSEAIEQALKQYDIDGSYLEIEITESAFLDEPEAAINMLNKIRALGVRIALDDFGTGYSSFSLLRTLPIDILKIDRSFISDLSNGKNSIRVFEAIVQLAKKLQLVTVAEGIETARQHELILLAKCDHAQGYYYAKPMKEENADDLVRNILMKNKLITHLMECAEE